jgi:hypothetical protein
MSFARQQEQKPQDILGEPAARRLLVRRVIERDDAIAEAFFDVALSEKDAWDHQEWLDRLARYEQSNETIGRWLNRRR